MRQTLFYLPVEILGVPLFGKGLLFWAILLAGLVAIVRALVQKKRIEDSIALIGMYFYLDRVIVTLTDSQTHKIEEVIPWFNPRSPQKPYKFIRQFFWYYATNYISLQPEKVLT